MLPCGAAVACAGLGPAPEAAMGSKILRAAVPLSLRFELATDVSVPRFPRASSSVAGPYVAVCFVDADVFVDVGGTCGICLSGDGPLLEAGAFAGAPALFCGRAAGGALVETRKPLAVVWPACDGVTALRIELTSMENDVGVGLVAGGVVVP
jgi:hypothetical protein